jgi:type VI secretion system secreted protein Hcp
MFLKVAGVTGEAVDADHKGEIEVVSWSWGGRASGTTVGRATGRAAWSELTVIKRVDAATPTLMHYLHTNRVVPTVLLTVRKAGTTPLEYFRIELGRVRILALTTASAQAELTEHLELGFQSAEVTYTPQQSGTGARGGGGVLFATGDLAGQ